MRTHSKRPSSKKLKEMQNLSASLVTVCLLGSAHSSPLLAFEEGSKPEPQINGKYALLVGINKYGLKPLSGAVNDVKDFKEVLVNTFNFSDDGSHIVSLTDESATKKNILERFRTQLIENAKRDPDGLFVFQFSGHGIQVTDNADKPDEADGLDEALVPFDVNGKVFKNPDQLRANLITDDELAVLMKELCGATKNVIVVTDCCRSGTNLRAIGTTSRHMDMGDFGIKAKAEGKAGDSKDFFEDFDLAAQAERYVAISGSDASHDSCETFQRLSDSDDKFNGLLTKSLIGLLKTSRSDITYRQLADRLRAIVSTESAQNPQIEGDLDRYVFADYKQKADPFFSVTKFEKNKATLNAGSALGIKNGAVFSFYSSDAKFLRGKDKLFASGTVTKVTPFECIVVVDAGLPEAQIMQSKAVLSAPDSATQRQTVCLDSSVVKVAGADFDKFEKSLKEAADDVTAISIKVEPEDALNSKTKGWNLAICADSLEAFKQSGGITRDSDSSAQTKGVFLCRPNGQPVAYTWVPLSQDDAAAEIAKKARLVANQDTVRSIFNETSKLNGLLQASLWLVKEKSTRDGTQWTKTECLSKAAVVPRVKAGEHIVVTVTNKSETPLYIGMLSLGTSGRIIPLYPPAAGSEEKLEPGKSVDLTRCKITPPIGHETFKLIASTEPVNLALLKQEGLTRGGASGVPDRLAARGPQLQNILMRAAGVQTRGEPVIISSFDQDWTANDLNFVIE